MAIGDEVIPVLLDECVEYGFVVRWSAAWNYLDDDVGPAQLPALFLQVVAIAVCLVQ